MSNDSIHQIYMLVLDIANPPSTIKRNIDAHLIKIISDPDYDPDQWLIEIISDLDYDPDQWLIEIIRYKNIPLWTYILEQFIIYLDANQYQIFPENWWIYAYRKCPSTIKQKI